MKTKNYLILAISFVTISLLGIGCSVPKNVTRDAKMEIPPFQKNMAISDTSLTQLIDWKTFFNDQHLTTLIDTALKNNQELNIVLQEINISKNEVLEKEGEYQPFVNLGIGGGTEKAARFTRNGAVERQLAIKDDNEFPDPLGDIKFGARASWELDIWKKLRNAKNSAQYRFLASYEAKNYLVTLLVSEIADSYYELLALDNLLDIVQQNVVIQESALKNMRLLKMNGEATQLAVNRFEAQLLNTKNLRYAIKQNLVETENRINYLVGRYPQPIARSSVSFIDLQLDGIQTNVPSELLLNRPDIKQAEYELEAANLDISVAKANFYPSMELTAELGFQAFNPKYLLNPESALFNLGSELVAPLVNRKAIKAQYYTTTAMQIQAVYHYEERLLSAYTEVINELNKIKNYSDSFEMKQKEVSILNQSVVVANNLFKNARADYVEVLLTQEEVLDSKMELTEAKLMQLNAKVHLYRTLGGGWN
jgi:NodT family efflux transporter outer membrane factor (OMF) lipoprotein